MYVFIADTIILVNFSYYKFCILLEVKSNDFCFLLLLFLIEFMKKKIKPEQLYKNIKNKAVLNFSLLENDKLIQFSVFNRFAFYF